MINNIKIKLLKNKINLFILSALIFLVFISFGFAWNAVWTEGIWNALGKSISPAEFAKDFKYLYYRLPDPSADNSCNDNDLLQYDFTAKRFVCFSCNDQSGVQFKSMNSTCTNGVPPACRIWYRISDDSGYSEWFKTPWSYFSSSGWVEGPEAQSPGSSARTVKVQMKMDCSQAPSAQQIVYRVNVDQWNGSVISDIDRPEGATAFVDNSASEGTEAISRTVVTPNNAVFGAYINSNGTEKCNIQYRIAGDGGHWSFWQKNGDLAFTGRAQGKTYLSYMNNVVLQTRLCCGNLCN